VITIEITRLNYLGGKFRVCECFDRGDISTVTNVLLTVSRTGYHDINKCDRKSRLSEGSLPL